MWREGSGLLCGMGRGRLWRGWRGGGWRGGSLGFGVSMRLVEGLMMKDLPERKEPVIKPSWAPVRTDIFNGWCRLWLVYGVGGFVLGVGDWTCKMFGLKLQSRDSWLAI